MTNLPVGAIAASGGYYLNGVFVQTESAEPVNVGTYDLTSAFGIQTEINALFRGAPDAKDRQVKYNARFTQSGRTVLAGWDPYLTKLSELLNPFGELDNGLPKVNGTITLPSA